MTEDDEQRFVAVYNRLFRPVPIRQTVITHLTSQGVPDSAADQTESSTFRWLPVTQANLALLQPPAVPAGFTKVNPAGQ